MNPDDLIIEDFNFCQYPIVRLYPLGNKTVIQIGEVSFDKSRSELLDEIDDLNKGISGLEYEIKELESSGDDLEAEKEKLNEQIDSAFLLLEENFDYLPDYSETIGWNITALKDFLNNKARSNAEWEELEEKIAGLKIDNRALASTIADQNETIADLTEQLLAAQEN